MADAPVLEAGTERYGSSSLPSCTTPEVSVALINGANSHFQTVEHQRVINQPSFDQLRSAAPPAIRSLHHVAQLPNDPLAQGVVRLPSRSLGAV